MRLDPEILESIFTNTGKDLAELSANSPILLVFLRHFGCTFCREALSDISKIRTEATTFGNIQIVLVHMSDDLTADQYLLKYGMADVPHVSDTDMSLYDYFGLDKGNFWQLHGLKVWLRGLKAGLIDGHGLTLDNKLGDYAQMPGVFVIYEQQIKAKFIHRSAADRPDYLKIVREYFGK
jgi:hypothetical protein